MQRLLATAATCLALGACANPSGAPGTRASNYDGSYAGNMRSLHASSLSCSAAQVQPQTLMVENGAVVWPTAGTKYYASIGSDGAFASQNGTVFMSGKITNNAMVARVNTGACHQIYELNKVA